MVFLFVGEQFDFCLLVESENGSCSLPLDETYPCLGHYFASLLTTTFLKAFCGGIVDGRVYRRNGYVQLVRNRPIRAAFTHSKNISPVSYTHPDAADE